MHAVGVPSSHLLNISGFEAWLPRVTGGAYAERAQQWVNMFRYHRQTQLVANSSNALNAALSSMKTQQDALEIGVPLAKTLSAQYSKMVTLLLEYMSTPGTLGSHP